VLSRHLLSLLLLTPIAGALAVLSVPRQRPSAIRGLAGLVAVVSVLSSLLLWNGYDPGGVTWQFSERLDVLPSIGAAYSVGVDGFSIALLLVTTATFAIALLAARSDTPHLKELAFLILLLQTGLLGTLIAIDLLLYFGFVALTFVTTCVIVRLCGSDRRPSAFPTVAIHLGLAAAALLAGIVTLHIHHRSATGIATFDLVRFLDLSMPADTQAPAFAAFFVGFAMVAAMFPAHRWLTRAMEEVPTPVAIVLMAAMLKMGTYGLIRFCLPLLPDAARQAAPFVTGAAVVATVCSVAGAFRQTDWRRVVAHISAASIAVMVWTTFRLTPPTLTASILQVDHAVVAGVWLFVARSAYGRRGADHPAEPGGAPRAGAVFAVGLVLMILLSAWSVVAGTRRASTAFLRLVETSVGRVIARVDPAYAPVVRQPSDCAAPAVPVAPSANAPGGWVTTPPCNDLEASPTTPRPGGDRR